jgi:hypothetical protein
MRRTGLGVEWVRAAEPVLSQVPDGSACDLVSKTTELALGLGAGGVTLVTRTGGETTS